MDSRIVRILAILGVTAVTTFGDFFLEWATKDPNRFVHLPKFLIGWFIYSLTAVGWFLVYRFEKLSTVGPIYSIFTILFFVFYSVVIFKESISGMEIFGIILALVALIILGRFA